MKQLMISLSRESGSGGHEIAEFLAQQFSLPLYDKNILSELAQKHDLNEQELRKYEETPRRPLLSRRVRGLSNSAEEGIAAIQFDFLRQKASTGQSFVVVGRCSDFILREYPGLISLFITGDPAARTERLCQRRGLTESDALDVLIRQDKRRQAYHDSHCDTLWGDVDAYDLAINSSVLGIPDTGVFLASYIRQVLAHRISRPSSQTP